MTAAQSRYSSPVLMSHSRPQGAGSGRPRGLRKVVMARPERYTYGTVRYLPLGSPWATQKRLYAQSRCMLVTCGAGCTAGGYPGLGYTGWVHRVGTTLPPPGSPLFGIARAQPMPDCGSASTRALQGPLLGPLRTPWLLALKWPQIPASGPIRRDTRYIILKLVNNPECHLN